MAVEPGPAPVFVNAGVSPHALLVMLPDEKCRARLQALRDRREDARAMVPLGEDVRLAASERIVAEQQLRKLQAPAQEFGYSLRATDVRVIAQQKLVEELTEAATAIRKRYEEKIQASQGIMRTLDAVEAWLQSLLPNMALESYDASVPRLAKGETVLDGVSRHREQAATIKKKLADIAAAPLPVDEAKALAKAQCEELARLGKPGIVGLFKGQPITWPTQNMRTEILNVQSPAIGFTQADHAIAFACWVLTPSVVFGPIEREIDAQAAQHGLTLTPEAKEVATAETAEELLEIEHQTCRLIDVGLSKKLPVEFADENPAAILGVRLVQVPVGVPRGTSPERPYDIVGVR